MPTIRTPILRAFVPFRTLFAGPVVRNMWHTSDNRPPGTIHAAMQSLYQRRRHKPCQCPVYWSAGYNGCPVSAHVPLCHVDALGWNTIGMSALGNGGFTGVFGWQDGCILIRHEHINRLPHVWRDREWFRVSAYHLGAYKGACSLSCRGNRPVKPTGLLQRAVMPNCPKCRYSFQVPDDDSPEEHGCYRCGYGTEPEPDEPEGPQCIYCGEPITWPLDDNEPYCSALCACYAMQDNEDDRP